jgi:hypothetical protein
MPYREATFSLKNCVYNKMLKLHHVVNPRIRIFTNGLPTWAPIEHGHKANKL